jgi:methanogenic corrinoid protein MtbC1
VRNVSANPHIIVLVGGRMINENPGLAMEVGADGTGADALAALELANSLVMTAAARDLNLR